MTDRDEPTESSQTRERGGAHLRDRGFLEGRLATGKADAERIDAPAPHFRRQLVAEYRSRQHLESTGRSLRPSTVEGRAVRAAERASPADLGGIPAWHKDIGAGWRPLGPSAVLDGQAATHPGPAVSGRVDDLAVAGSRVYAATANGGVWRSLDSGTTWESMMEAWPFEREFDKDPGYYRSDSLACGAIALVPGSRESSDLLYVGSGEAFNNHDFYFGVGPLVSRNGGRDWIVEATDAEGPPLQGTGFFELAVSSADSELVLAATRLGLYQRVPSGGKHHWVRQALGGKKDLQVTSVVAAPSGAFYAAEGDGGVYSWSGKPAEGWRPVGSGFPSDRGRITLALSADAKLVYALGKGGRVHRLDVASGQWREVGDLQEMADGVRTGRDKGWNDQENYNLALAVDPRDGNTFYVGMSSIPAKNGKRDARKRDEEGWIDSGALYRCVVVPADLSVKVAYLGSSVHADIHALRFEGSGQKWHLWVGCDGGVFRSGELFAPATEPAASDLKKLFEPRNEGLATVTLEMLGQHPEDPETLYCGSQDNGCVEYVGEGRWRLVHFGDSGAALVNWHDPDLVLISLSKERLSRRTASGWEDLKVPVPGFPKEKMQFYPPLVAVPVNDRSPADANVVAFGTERVWISEQFGAEGSWTQVTPRDEQTPGVKLNAPICSLAFADAKTLYAGTAARGIYRYKKEATGWERKRLDITRGDLPDGRYPVTGIAVAGSNSIYVTLGGQGDFPRVYRYSEREGWTARSGPEPKRLFVMSPLQPCERGDLDAGKIPNRLQGEFVQRDRQMPALDLESMISPVVPGLRWHLTEKREPGRLIDLRAEGNKLVVTEESSRLLHVQHNAILVDPDDPQRVFVGADIGVWHSFDGGRTWELFSRGLPDAAVLDLQIFPPPGKPAPPSKVRRLRAATHGRGLFERVADENSLLTIGRVTLATALGTDLDRFNAWQKERAGTDWRQRPVTDLRNSDLSRIYVDAVDLARVELDGADLGDTVILRSNLNGACLRGCKLQRAQISSTHFSDAELSGADLTGAFLDCNLGGANLSGADLTGARLHASRVGKTRWRDARLHGADLSRVNLDPVDGREADWTGALYDGNTKWPADFDPRAKGAVRR